MAVRRQDVAEVADDSVGHIVKPDDVRSLEFDHGELLLRQRWQDSAVAAEEDDVILADAEVKIKHVLTEMKHCGTKGIMSAAASRIPALLVGCKNTSFTS